MARRVQGCSAMSLVFAVLAAGVACGEERPLLVSRDAVWRSIFVRPQPAPAPPSALNAVLAARIALGASLFVDARLSGDGARSCASCHDPAHAFTDGRPKARARC